MTQAKVWKMREYFVYFPFFILHDWDKRSAEERSSHLSGVALRNRQYYTTEENDVKSAETATVTSDGFYLECPT